MLAVLALESRRARTRPVVPRADRRPPSSRTLLPAALLFAIAFWATEFDWGVPQYRVVWHPLLLALAGGIALTCGRVILGRGGALRVVGVYLVLRGALELAVWSFGRSVPAMPLFVVEAIVVELIALAVRSERGGGRAHCASGRSPGWPAAPSASPRSTRGPTCGRRAVDAVADRRGLPTAILAGLAGGGLGALLGAGLRRNCPRARSAAAWACRRGDACRPRRQRALGQRSRGG